MSDLPKTAKVVRKLRRTALGRPLPPAPPPEPPPPPKPEAWHQPPDLPRGKEMISLRLDAEILDHFRGRGRGYQSRINAVLRAYVAAQKP